MPSKDLERKHEDLVAKARDDARGMLSNYLGRAVEVLTEIMELGENDRVRLSAANSVLDRAGVTAPTEQVVTVTQEEKAVVRAEASDLIERIQANMAAREARTDGLHGVESLMIHEGGVIEDDAS